MQIGVTFSAQTGPRSFNSRRESARDGAATYLVTADRVRAIVDVEMVVAVQLQLVETQHEPLEDAMRLEGDGAVKVPLVLRDENRPVDLPVEVPHEVLLAHVAHLICEQTTVVELD